VAFELDRIYLGDCRELMREIPDQSVDLVLTDPQQEAD
jgi:DNA modification methylase